MTMKLWFPAIALLLLAVASADDSKNSSFPDNRTSFFLTYEYRIDLNVSHVIPSIDVAIDLLHNDTLAAIEELVEDGDNPLFLVFGLDTEILDDDTSCRYSSELCVMAESTAMLSLRAHVDERLVEFAALEEVQKLLEVFSGNHANVTLSFVGPFVVRTDIIILLEGVSGRMDREEIQVFETAFMSVIGPPLLNNDPSIVLRSAAVFLQQVSLDKGRRRLQASDGNESVIARIHVTGQCNQCSSNDFARITGEAVDIRRPDLQRDLRENQVTDYFGNVSVSIPPKEEAPGISDCCLDFYPEPDPFPYWVFIVTGACVVIITASVCCSAFCSKQERSKQQQEAKRKSSIARTKTDDASEPSERTVMPHLRQATKQRLSSSGNDRASSLTF